MFPRVLASQVLELLKDGSFTTSSFLNHSHCEKFSPAMQLKFWLLQPVTSPLVLSLCASEKSHAPPFLTFPLGPSEAKYFGFLFVLSVVYFVFPTTDSLVHFTRKKANYLVINNQFAFHTFALLWEKNEGYSYICKAI